MKSPILEGPQPVAEQPHRLFFEPLDGLRLMAGLDSVIKRANKGRAPALLQTGQSRPGLCEVLSRSFK